MEDKTVLVTGANRGRGLSIATALAARGARVILACRNMERGERAMEAIRAATSSQRLSLARVDLSDMESVRGLAGQVLANEARLDVLICNGGVALDR
jgi:NAD(P)-dependent dehydrogenase (short-subunit alcohol dehydrogenase family)